MNSKIQMAANVLDIEARGLNEIKAKLSQEPMQSAFVKAVDFILKAQGSRTNTSTQAGKVVISGMGKSGHIARKIASTMSSTGTPAFFLHPAESAHGDLGVLSANDVVIVISYGGSSPELQILIQAVKRLGIPLIAMTANPSSELARVADCVLDIRVEKEACPLELAPTASSTVTLALGDALAMVLMQEKGFSEKDFAQNHPGGSLGFRLSTVRDHMHAGAGFVVVDPTLEIKNVITYMSRAETRGAAAVVNDKKELMGIVTDGDLRRRLEKSDNPLDGTALDVMGKNPKTIEASETIERALFLMEQFKIQLLLVTDMQSSHPRNPIGVLHIHDILKAKGR